MSVISRSIFDDAQAMWEADAAAEWERINTPDPDKEKMIESADLVGNAYDSIGKAMEWLCDAVKEAEGTVAEDKIASLMNDLEDLQDDVLSMKFRLMRGEC